MNLQTVPAVLSQHHTDWTNLDLGFNQFELWPELNVFNNLVELWLTGNKIRQFGNDLRGLGALQVLYINGNQIQSIPDSIGFLVSLKKLDAGNNKIREISPMIGKLTQLEELNLTGNVLESLPPEFGQLNFLELLDLSGNKITGLPTQFPGCIRLLELNLGNNQLSKLPGDFGNMSRLVSLNLADNKLTDLPLSMGACVHLDSVLLERNPIKDAELMRKYNIGTDHLNDYLAKRLFAFTQDQKKRKREMERAKKEAAKLRGDIRDKEDDNEDKKTAIPVSRRLDGFNDDDEILTDEQKHAKIRAHSQKLAGECRHEVITLKRALQNANTLEDIVPIAKAIRDLIPHMNLAREQMAPIPKPKPPLFQGEEDKVMKLKKTTAVALREFESVLGGIFNVVSGNAPLEQLIPLSSVITGSLGILQEATRQVPQV
jgi:Leucine-rich repeat (LRR) protein